MSLGIRIATIPHDRQRYDTCGDWLDNNPAHCTVLVSDMSDWRHEFLVGIHELVESALCFHRGITEADVTAFDKAFEEERAAGRYPPQAEPGDHPAAPYGIEHAMASAVERMMAVALGVQWAEYEAAINKLGEP